MSSKTLTNFTHTRFTTCDAPGIGCDKYLTKGNNCYLSSKYITHLQCIPSKKAQIDALKTGKNTYVALKDPSNGMISLRRMRPIERLAYLQAQINSGDLAKFDFVIAAEKEISTQSELMLPTIPEQDETALTDKSEKTTTKDSGMASLTEDDHAPDVFPSKETALEENNDVFEPESSVAAEQRGLALFCNLINSNHASTAEQEAIIDAIQNIEEVGVLICLLCDEEASKQSIQEASKAIKEYEKGKQFFIPANQHIVAMAIIQKPAQKKITQLAAGTSKQPL